MAQALYDAYKEDLLDSTVQNFTGGAIDVIFVTTGYSFSAAHTSFTNLGANAVGDGGTARANAENLQNPSATSGVADADDPVFASVTGTNVNAFVVFYDSGTDGTSLLFGYFDSIGTATYSAQQVTIAFDAAGIFYL